MSRQIPLYQRPAKWRGFLLAMIAMGCVSDQPTSPPLGEPVAAVASAAQSYIVVLAKGSNPNAVAATAGVTPRWIYRAAINGFAADLPPQAVIALQRNPLVSYIEPDGVVEISDTQLSPPWGLDRIDQRDLPLSNSYTYPNTGTGVTVYVIDTGIWYTHTDFGGRASFGIDFTSDGGWFDYDCHGHGTHVAGTIGGATYGVAKDVTLVGLRVFTCLGNGTWSDLIAAIDWVALNGVRPAVVNMSLGGDYIQSVNDATTNLVAAGVSVVVAAGNANQDACAFSPASVPNAITVGASNINDWKASFSNWGSCLDLFAPGDDILSTWTGRDMWETYPCGDTCTNWLSGTSMATPHVVGAVALYLSANPGASPQQVRDALVNAATQGRLTNPFGSSWPTGSPNRLLFVDWTGAQPPSPPPPPSAEFTTSCAHYTCTFTAVNDGSWTFGDGTGVGSGLVVSHTFAARSQYTVRHSVGTETASVTVNCKPRGRCQ